MVKIEEPDAGKKVNIVISTLETPKNVKHANRRRS